MQDASLRMLAAQSRWSCKASRRQAAAALRNVAATARNAASLAGSLTFECNITFELPSFGSLCVGPMSTNPGGAIRRASGAIASPASAAATTAVTPPPTKRSRHLRPALSSARTAMARTPQGGARVASGKGCPFGTVKRRDANQPNSSSARIIGLLHLAREADDDGKREVRRDRMQAFEQGYQLRPRSMVGDAERERLRD